MEIVLREQGGLGNQLFQYAALRYYAKRYGASMRIVVDPPWNAQSYGYPRPCLLSHFNLSVPMRERTLIERLILTEKPWLKLAVAPLRWGSLTQVFSQEPARRYFALHDLPLAPLVKTLYLVGWWHTHDMIDVLEEELRSEFTFKEPAKGRNLEVLQQIEQSPNPVSIHVRRGDTILAATGRVALPGSYYADAIANLKARLTNPTFFVFSDDIAFVKEHLPWIPGSFSSITTTISLPTRTFGSWPLAIITSSPTAPFHGGERGLVPTRRRSSSRPSSGTSQKTAITPS